MAGVDDGGFDTSSDEEFAEDCQEKLKEGLKRLVDHVLSSASSYYRSSAARAYDSGYSHSAPRPGREKNMTDPKKSKWYTDYQDLRVRFHANDSSRKFQTLSNKWRRRFRVPLETFERLVQTCKDAGLGIKAAGRGRNPHPLELKVMGVLRVLGRSVCFDDLEDSTFIARADGSVCYGRLKHSSPRG